MDGEKKMNLFTPTEFVENYASAGAKKCVMPILKMIILACLSGFFIALGGVVLNTAAHSISTPGLARVFGAAVFPVGIVMVVLTGAELFTGNCLITISVLSKHAKVSGMLRNLAVVFLGNFAGSVLIAAACAFFGQFELGGGQLAVHTIRLAAAKTALPFMNAFTSAAITNMLVCIAVMCASSAKDIGGRVIGAYIPVFAFVVCGFEHSVANMYYIPAGIFASSVPKYAVLATEAGVDMSGLGWGSFLTGNLLPVTLGNVVGGVLFAAAMWYCHGKKKQ